MLTINTVNALYTYKKPQILHLEFGVTNIKSKLNLRFQVT